MICTEEEAAAKWCPLAQSSRYGKRIDNRPSFDLDTYRPYTCVGSKCMWWIWTSLEHEKGYCANGGG